MEFVKVTFRDLQSLLVGPIILLKTFPPLGRMNFLLTVLTGISDPKLCLGFDFHSLQVLTGTGVWFSLITCGDVCSVKLEIQRLNPPG